MRKHFPNGWFMTFFTHIDGDRSKYMIYWVGLNMGSTPDGHIDREDDDDPGV